MGGRCHRQLRPSVPELRVPLAFDFSSTRGEADLKRSPSRGRNGEKNILYHKNLNLLTEQNQGAWGGGADEEKTFPLCWLGVQCLPAAPKSLPS